MTFEPSPAARDMAEALRAGVSARLRDFDAAVPDEDLARLRSLGAIEDLPPAAKPTAWSPVVRGMRRLLRGLMRPWLAAQTAFNTAIAAQSVQTASGAHALSRRVTELERNVEALRDQVRLQADRSPGSADAAPRLDRDTLLRLIVQSRLRPPAARVLVRGAASIASDLQAFGYDVVADPRDQDLARSAAAFDAVVWHAGPRDGERGGAEWTEAAAHLLRVHGQAIVVHELDGTMATTAADGLVVRTRLIVREGAAGWTVVEESAAAAAVPRVPNAGDTIVIVGERVHAPDR